MAIQTIDLGSIPLDGTDGDNARQAFTKVNANFSDLDVRKVEAVAGKQLSTNDYTNADKSIVDNFQSNLNGRQPLNSKLTAIAESVWAANRLMYMTGAGAVGFTDFPAQARTFLAAATQAAQRTALGLGTVSILNANAFVQTFLNAASQAAQRTALGLGTASVLDANAFAQTFLNAASQAAQRTALGLGSAAVLNGNPFVQTFLNASSQDAQRTALGMDGPRVSGSSDLNTYTINGDWLLPSGADSTFANGPTTTGSELSRGLMYVNFSGTYGIQVLTSCITNRQWLRVHNAGWPTTWINIWNDVSLPIQQSFSDTTKGRVLLNQAHGLGYGAAGDSGFDITLSPTFNDAALLPNGWGAINAGETIDGVNFAAGTAVLTFKTYSGNHGGALAIGRLRGQIALINRSAGANQAPVTLWNSANLDPNKLEDRTQATLPSAAANKGKMYICTNTTTRGQRPVYSDGTNWRRLEDESLITAA